MIVGDVTEEMISWIGCDECCKLGNESESQWKWIIMNIRFTIYVSCSYKEIYVENYELQYHWLRYSEIILFNILFLCFTPFVEWMWMLTSYRM